MKNAQPSTFIDPITGMHFMYIPAGEFFMGNDKGEQSERPKHRTKISNPFYLGKFQVTQEQWELLMGYNPSKFKDKERPVENVTWHDAVKFIETLNSSGKKAYRLPTEAEWEYACRAGTSKRFFFGDEESKLIQYAWYYTADSNTNQMTQPVGQKRPNPWGLYDMLGNVKEWCWDRYDSKRYENISNKIHYPYFHVNFVR